MIPVKQEIDYEALGKKIKALRLKRGLTQDALAEKVHCYTSHVSNIENSHTKVSLNTLLAIANALDTSIDHLISEQYDDPSLALDNEILRAVQSCDEARKEQILKIIEILAE